MMAERIRECNSAVLGQHSARLCVIASVSRSVPHMCF